MKRFLWTTLVGVASMVVFCDLNPALAGEADLSANPAKEPVRMNCGAQIECVAPDGHAGQVSRLAEHDPGAIALIMDDDTVTCLLQEGETNFVIELPRTAVPDRFTFLNENATAHGELKIAVSNQRLPANSPEWTEVEGVVPFTHKRLFGVSLMGVEAKFVRLSFHVEKQGRVAAVASAGAPQGGPSDQHHQSAELPPRFQKCDLDDALNSKFAALHSRGSTLLLTASSLSVAPLPQMSRD